MPRIAEEEENEEEEEDTKHKNRSIPHPYTLPFSNTHQTQNSS
jgi:hypothetical protein